MAYTHQPNGMVAAVGSGDEEKSSVGGSVEDIPAPLENLFTLPFALHLRPLPHISYLAEQDSSNASSDQDDDEGASDASSANSNYKAGTHRLRPHSIPVPSHSLKMISMLLERTGCLDAVPVWAKLMEMLESADDDPHFTNLRAFFDARFDTGGRLQDRSRSRSRNRRRSKGSSSRSPTRMEDDRRRPSISSTSMALRRKKSGKRMDTFDLENGREATVQPKPRQPEIIVVGKEGTDTRTVRFKIRLDLHSIGLAPPPPKPPLMARKSTRSTIGQRLASSPPRASEHLEVQRVLSNTSSNHSHSESLSLYPIGSPDSFRSHTISEDSDDRSNGIRSFNPSNGSPIPSSRTKDKKSSRTFTNSSAALTSVTSEFGTSPDSGKGKGGDALGKMGSFSSKAGENVRRPSMIQRLMDFRNARSNSSRASNRSTSNMSNPSVDEVQSQDASLPKALNLSMLSDHNHTTNILPVASPTSESNPLGSGFSSQNAYRLRSHTVHSDLSNEEAVDLVDDEGSISSSQPYAAFPKRRTSSSANQNSHLGFRPAPDMGPVHEGAVFSAYPIHSDEDEMVASSTAASNEGWGRDESENFLNLWRKAANTSLTLRQTFRPTMASPSRTPKGSISTGLNSGAQTPPGSVEWEEQEHIESLLAPFRPDSENDAWWLSGSVDPLPISIACALSEGLGWNGIMELCYGKGSKSERSKAYQPLGRAAEMDRKQEADKDRVKNWAQSVAGTSNDAEMEERLDENLTEEEKAARDKLAALTISSTAGSEGLGPSESASAKGKSNTQSNLTKIGSWLRKRSGQDSGTEQQEVKSLPPSEPKNRSWQDWADLFQSIANWLVEYEMTRVRNGLAGEYGHEVEHGKVSSHVDSGFVDVNFDLGKTRYSTRASYQVPRCIIKDALNKQNGFRRRHGIPEGLPVGPDGVEVGDYRWARSRLSRNHFATSTLLAANSMAYCLEQIANSDWTHNSAWELDYLEMCVFQNPIMAKRFPSPGSRIVSANQTFQPDENDQESRKRAMPCPLPSADGVWSASAWRMWLSHVQKGNIIVPAVSWQAWWTLIAVLNGGDGSNRALDVQLKAEEEEFSALDDLEAVYL